MKTKPATVDEYLQQVPPDVRAKLMVIRKTIKKAAPKAEEKLSYGMPFYNYYGRLAYFAAFKDHYSFFVMKHVLIANEKDVHKYKTGAATLRFPIDKAVPVKLITKLVKYGAKANLEKAQFKVKRKK